MQSSSQSTQPSILQWLKVNLPEIERLERDRAVDSFSSFVKQAWPILEPGTPLVWTWYLQLLCDSLEKQMRGNEEYRKLLVCIPPGTGKSTIVNVLAPAWQWLHEPTRRKLCLSNDDRLAERDSRKMRDVILSPWYRHLVVYVAARNSETGEGRYTSPWSLAKDQAQKMNFENTSKGFRQSYSINAKLLGKRAHDITIDDALDAKAIILGSVEQVNKRLEDVNNVIEKTLPSRVDRMATARWTIIAQRLHENDPPGRAMAEGGWKIINIQMEYEPGNPLNPPEDPRKREGELLCSELFPAEEITKLKVKLGGDYSAQYQQKPLPRGGGMLKRHYWCFWYPRGIDPPPPVRVRLPDGTIHECVQSELPEGLANQAQSWDCAFKDTASSSFVVGQVWATLEANAYLLDQIRDRLDIIGTMDAIRTLTINWPLALAKLIEDRANGPAVMQMLRNEISGIDPWEPKGSKEERANAVAPLLRAGNVWLPHPAIAAWVLGFLDETEAFPSSTYKDQVDAMTQFLLHWRGGDFVLI